MKKTTIRDLAAACGCSKSTVARALNGKPLVALEVRRHILTLAHQMNYRSCSADYPRVIAILTAGFQYGIYRSLIEAALRAELHNAGFIPVVIANHDLESIQESMIEGVISICSEDRIAQLTQVLKNFPHVCVNDISRHIEQVYSVRTDPMDCQKKIISHLYSLGHRKISMLRRDVKESERLSRLASEPFLTVMRGYGLEETAYYETFRHPAELQTAMRRLLDHSPTAIIIMGEGFGAQAAHILKLCGKRIPEDISLVTQGVPFHSEYLDPPQTCVMQDYETLSRHAVQMLQKLFHGESIPGDCLIPAVFHERTSTAPPVSGTVIGRI